MAEIQIVETTLEDGTVGKCGYLEFSEDYRMTVEKHLIPGNTYTLSFFVKTIDSSYIDVIGGASDKKRIYDFASSSWRKVKFTFVSNGEYVQLYFPKTEYYFYALKLEDGKVATTWTASFADSLTETESIIDQKSDSITLKVEQNVMQKIGDDYVTKDNVVAEINAKINPETGTSEVQINAGAINLNGVVTANGKFRINEDGSASTTSGTFTESLNILGDVNTHSQFPEYYRSTMRLGEYKQNDADVYYYDDSTNTMEHSSEGGFISSQPYLALIDSIYDDYYLYSNLTVGYVYASGISILDSIYIGGDLYGNDISCNNIHAKKGWFENVSTKSGANLDTVKTKVDGSLKSTFFNSARGTSSAYPSVNIASIPVGTKIRIEVGVPIDNSGTISWMSYSTVKSNDTTDYLLNIGGYYYSNTYCASIFINLSQSRVTFNDSWTRVVGGTAGTNVSNLKSLSRINVYTENL